MRISEISEPDDQGCITVRYSVDSETMSHRVKVRDAVSAERDSLEMADPKNVNHIGSPSNGDLWVMHVRVGDVVKKGEEIFNISIMKQEKSVYAPVAGGEARAEERQLPGRQDHGAGEGGRAAC